MAYAPASPYPKGRGDSIRSADWNEAIDELIRIEKDKFNRSGGTISGNLTVTGTISGTLANNIVGPNQIAANAVVTAKIADGNVTSNKLAAGAISGDRLANASIPVIKLEGILMTNVTFTLGGGVGTTQQFQIHQENMAAGGRGYAILVFAYSPTPIAYFSYEVRAYTMGTAADPINARWAIFTNQTSTVSEIRCKIYGVPAPV